MKLISWNCRGLGNASAVRGLLDLQKRESPDILFLSGTKMDRRRIERFRWNLQMPNFVVKHCMGYSGGLALLWKRDVDVTIKSISKYHIDALVKEEDGCVWRLTGIYGEPKAEGKEKTWRILRTLNNLYKNCGCVWETLMKFFLGMRKMGGSLGLNHVWSPSEALWNIVDLRI
jgi:exonuclease III